MTTETTSIETVLAYKDISGDVHTTLLQAQKSSAGILFRKWCIRDRWGEPQCIADNWKTLRDELNKL